VTLTALRGNESEDVKALHYESIVKDLMIALENSFYVNEEDFGDAFTKKTGFEDFRDSIGMDWQHSAKSPTKTKDKYKGVSDYFYNLKLERFTNESLHKET
jgi:hypothetical protein